MDSKPLTSEQVIAAYQILLGRDPESDDTIQHHLATCPSFEAFREKVLTGTEFQSKYSALIDRRYGDVDHKAKIIGFSEDLLSWLSFWELFERVIAPRIEKRAETFHAAFRHLLEKQSQEKEKSLTILETGCVRSAGNWAGDGQSTLQFEYFVRKQGGRAISVDYSPLSVGIAHYFCPSVQIVLSDSVQYLEFMSRCASNLTLDLLYLDSMDVDPANPMRSAEHHLNEIRAAWPLLGKGSLVLIDDHDCPTPVGRLSKSVLANEWLTGKGGS